MSDWNVDDIYPGYTDHLFQIESNNGRDPASMDADASNRGLGQFGRSEEKQYGITNWRDPQQQRNAVNLESQYHYNILSNALGRPPTAAEMYLTHQQGPGGGPALLTANPNQPAWMAIRSKYGSDQVAQSAIGGNVLGTSPLQNTPTAQISTGAFRDMWMNKWNGGAPQQAGQPQVAQAQPGAPPVIPPITPGLGEDVAAAQAASQTPGGLSSNSLASAAANLMKQQPIQAPQMNLLSGPRGPNIYLQQLLAAMMQNPQDGSSSPV